MTRHQVRVLICDDHELFRECVKAVLEQEAWIEIVGEARNGPEAVEKALRLSPQVVLMDLSMPGYSGLLATEKIKKARSKIRVLVLSMYDDEEIVVRCLNAGASGYVQKGAQFSQLVQALEVVEGGGIYLSPGVFKKLSRKERASLQVPAQRYARQRPA